MKKFLIVATVVSALVCNSVQAATPDELYDYAWKSFYADESQEQKMFRLFCNVAMREMEEGTYRPRDRKLVNKSFGKDVVRNIIK